jgi:hypothetical protein
LQTHPTQWTATTVLIRILFGQTTYSSFILRKYEYMSTTYWSVTSVIIVYIFMHCVYLILVEYSWLLPASKQDLFIMDWTLHYLCENRRHPFIWHMINNRYYLCYVQWNWCHVSDDYRTFHGVRLNALDFRDLQDKVSRPITVLQNVTFHRTLTDRFLDAFREQVAENPVYETSQVSFKPVYDYKLCFLKASRNSVWFIITYFRSLFNNLLI